MTRKQKSTVDDPSTKSSPTFPEASAVTHPIGVIQTVAAQIVAVQKSIIQMAEPQFGL